MESLYKERSAVYHSTVNVAALLKPYNENLSDAQFGQIASYIDILLRWNARMNLTAIRDPEEIVLRHFGESVFLARKLCEAGLLQYRRVIDVGSGAGFPGIPLKIAQPDITLTLVEAQQRKAVFLKEVLRAINLDAEVKNCRAEDLAESQPASADLVTLRAVERFEAILPVASQLVRATGHLATLIGSGQVSTAQNLLKTWKFAPLWEIPGSETRVILLANQAS